MLITTEDIVSMNATEYKKYHESLMQNNNGTSAAYVFFSIFFICQCCIKLAFRTKQYPLTLQYVFEYAILVLPMTLSLTFLTDYVLPLNVGMFVINLYHLFNQYHSTNCIELIKQKMRAPNKYNSPRLKSVTFLRSLTYMITVFCILAVDFHTFPRYLAKTENYGYSVMDTGVGLFVLMSGLVHKEWTVNNYKVVFKGNAKFTFALVLLGVFRFVSLKTLDYQEHISEYGVHWNFFFTLAASKIISTTLLTIINSPLFLSILVLIIHEVILYKIQMFVLSNSPRIDFWSANREGISSCLGYVAMYLFAVYIKREINDKFTCRYKIWLKLIIICLILWPLAVIVNIYLPTSRTLANAGYCLYLEAYLVTVLPYMFFIESIFDENDKLTLGIPWILSVINQNGLVFFLIANLLTGAVNLSVKTLAFSNTSAFMILNIYMNLSVLLTVISRKIVRF